MALHVSQKISVSSIYPYIDVPYRRYFPYFNIGIYDVMNEHGARDCFSRTMYRPPDKYKVNRNRPMII
jgi:hypothetical protein